MLKKFSFRSSKWQQVHLLTGVLVAIVVFPVIVFQIAQWQVSPLKQRIEALEKMLLVLMPSPPVSSQIPVLQSPSPKFSGTSSRRKTLRGVASQAALSNSSASQVTTSTSTLQISVIKELAALEKGRIEAENTIRIGMFQAIGAIALAGGLYFTWRNLKVTEDKQVAERFAKAIELLGNENIHIRLGAIYALERIANDSDKDYWQVIEVLTAYIRERSPWSSQLAKRHRIKCQSQQIDEDREISPPLPTDIQAVLTVLGRRRYTFKDGESLPLNLQDSDLRNANLNTSQKFQGANFTNANLQDADLENGNFQEAQFTNANLSRVWLRNANLQSAKLRRTVLREAVLTETILKSADLWRAKLEGADLRQAKLQQANLQSAILSEADLTEAELQDATLAGTKLDLVVGLTQEQLDQVSSYKRATLPKDLQRLEGSS